MNRLMSAPQWLRHLGMSADNGKVKRGRGSGKREDDNRDNGDKNTDSVHSHSSKRATFSVTVLIVLLQRGGISERLHDIPSQWLISENVVVKGN